MRPASGSSRPASRRSSVDLPAPFGPTSPIRARGGTTRLTSVRTGSAPYDFETPAATSEPVRRDMRDDLQHELLAPEIEGRRRLVEQQHRCLLRERAREHRTLQLAAAERTERTLRETLEFEAA